MTGRGAGYCAGYGMPGYANPYFAPGYGRGRGNFGRGRGGGRGWRHRYYATGVPGWAAFDYAPQAAAPPQETEAYAGMSPEEEMAWLKNQAKHVEGSLRRLNKRISDLENEMKNKE